MTFEWDHAKNRGNIAKHGLGFDEALRVFADPHLIIRQDRVAEGEERLHAIEYVNQVLLVVHTIREEGIDAAIRIVSARRATASERKLYEEGE